MSHTMYHFIVNPRSKTGHALSIWKTVEEELKKRHVDYQVHFTECTGHARRIARFLTTGDVPMTIVAIGGDGTVNEVLEGILIKDSVTFGYIPTGSGNDFAKGMQIPQDTLEALELILNGTHTSLMDVGTVGYSSHSHAFGVSCGIGFDAAICHEALASPIKTFLNRLKLGKLTYVLIAIRQLLLWTPSPMTITMDDGRQIHFDRAYFATAFNQPCEGGGLRICPHASPRDQLLDVCVVSDVPKFLILLLLPTAYWGKHLFIHGVHIYQCRSIDIHSEQILPVHRDGESCGKQKNIRLSLKNNPLKVITPVL